MALGCIKKGFYDFMNEYKPDIICIQETKAHKEQVEFFQIILTNFGIQLSKKDIQVLLFFLKLNH